MVVKSREVNAPSGQGLVIVAFIQMDIWFWVCATAQCEYMSVGEGEHDDEGRDNGLYCKWFSIWNKTRFFRPSPFLMHSGQKSPKLDHLLQRTFKKVVYYTVSKNGDFSVIAQWAKMAILVTLHSGQKSTKMGHFQKVFRKIFGAQWAKITKIGSFHKLTKSDLVQFCSLCMKYHNRKILKMIQFWWFCPLCNVTKIANFIHCASNNF